MTPLRFAPLRLVATPIVVTVFAGLVGCSKASAERAAPAPSAAPTPSDVVSAIPTAPPDMQSLQERFASEAKSRPAGTIRVEDAFATFQKSGAALREQRQHLGAPFLAVYCAGAQAGVDLHLSVCEYRDAARAREGKEMSERSFGAVANRTLYLNGATTLTVRVGSAGDRALADKLARAFAELRPNAR